MLRHYSKRSVLKSIRFTESTNKLVREFQDILSAKHPLPEGESFSWSMVAERAIQAYLAETCNSEASLKAELNYYRTHSYMKDSPKALKEEAKG
jgi:hypothetical protein